jgi:hypothetical protein
VNISLSAAALQAHFDDLTSDTAGKSRLPSLDEVPIVLGQDNSSSGDEPLALDRGTLQTLLTVDGRRTVQDIVTQRGSPEAVWQLATLVGVGLVRIDRAPRAASADAPRAVSADAPRAASADAPAAQVDAAPAERMPGAPHAAFADVTTTPVDAPPVEVIAPPQTVPTDVEPVVEDTDSGATDSVARPITAMTVVAGVSVHCPKLGFEDDPSSSFGRPTRMHRCFAAGAPLPLSLDQQRELCLSDQFGTCPRLTMGGFAPPAVDVHTASDLPSMRDEASGSPWPGPEADARGLALRRPEPDADDTRIVRLPFAARASAADRGAVADRQAVGGAEPTRFRSAGAPVPDRSPTPPTPMRSRLGRANGSAADAALVEPAPELTPDPILLTTESSAVDEALVGEPVEGRPGGVPVRVIAGGAAILAVLAVIVFMVSPQVANRFADETPDSSLLPNTSTGAAGTPGAQLTAPRATSVARATVVASGGFVAVEPDAAASATSKVDQNAPESSAAGAQPAPAKPSAVAAQPAAASAGAAQPAAAGPSGAAAPAASTLLDERFANNDRNWPSSPQGTASLTNGSYRLVPRQSGQFVAIGAPIADTLKDVVVNATFHKLTGPLGGGYGIIVRDQASVPQDGTSQVGHYYVLEVGDKGEVGMWRRAGGGWVDLLPWQPNAAVKPGTASNDVSVRAVGNRLSLTVNGTLVATKTDDTFTAGGVGLFVGGDGNQVAVDRFSILKP